ncbi:hypothetical protein F2Q70_00039266 [Brassica cretica]|uniref:Uncharacterized protein n=1 Tax=Brassica cretica TaxID=69181 RepID=A0A8S9K9A6_BRACR|nr:hypothetical protein F2Q70_00039266 [Brassica cretica]
MGDHGTSLLHWQSFNNKCRLSNNRCCRCSRPSKISNKLLKKQLRTPHEKSVEHDRSKSVNSIDDLAAKVDQLLKGNQSQVFIMEEAAPEKSAGDLAFDAEISGDDQQEVSYVNGQGWQLKNYHPNPNHFGIDLSKYKVNTEIQYLDIKYLMACHIMRDEDTYSFFDKEGTQLFTKRPHPKITRLSVFDNIRFLPPPKLLCTDPRAAAPDADMEDVEGITPEADPSYDLGELADVTDDQAYRRWMVDS